MTVYADFDLNMLTLPLSVISMVTNFGIGLGVVICHHVINVCIICRVCTGVCLAMAMLLTVFFCLHVWVLSLVKQVPYKGK